MAEPVNIDQKGFTLVEFLVAIVILTVGLLGLLQSVNVSIQNNLTSELRREASVIADEEITKDLAKGSSQIGFDAISTTTKSYPVQRKVLTGFRNFSVTKIGSSVSANSKQVDVQVVWRYKGNRHTYGGSSVVTRSQQ